MKKAIEQKAGKRDLSNFKEIFISVKNDILLKIAREETKLKASIQADSSATRSHIADSNAPDYAAITRKEDLKKELVRINAAIKHLKDPSFGICQDPDCGARIDDARLFVNPFTDKCHPCQSDLEKETVRKKKNDCCRSTLPKRR
jgi:RNA polymerase-binding transcription factor DksA